MTSPGEARFQDIEVKAEGLRKLLLGCLLLSKEAWRDEALSISPALLMALEEAEDAFPDLSLEDRLERAKNSLDVSLKRAGALFEFLQALSVKGKGG